MHHPVELRPATDEEKRQRDVLTHSAWGRALTLEGFLQRESRLRAHAWAKEAMTTWVLVGARGEVLSSCETFRVASTLNLDGGARAGDTSAIASVFTEARLRGRGYASRMMQLLSDELRRRPNAQAAILFSDVGPDLYGRAGFIARPAEDRIFPPAAGDPAAEVDALVTDDALSTVFPLQGVGRFRVQASPAQLDWHLERERIYAELLGRCRPSACGARADRGLALWTANFKEDELVLLVFQASSPVEADALMCAARRTASAAQLSHVRLWEPTLPFAWPMGEGKRQPRDGSLPMLLPLERGVRPEDWRDVPRALWV